MPPLSPFWTVAARLSGRVDLSGLTRAGLSAPDRLAVEALVRLGIGPRHAARLAQAREEGPREPCLTLLDPRYPEHLRSLPCAPGVLFYAGNLDLLARPGVAIVGSRACTASGRRMAAVLSRAVALAGGAVVSGLARGVDTAAHRAALASTVAVLGHALDHRCSADQARLQRDIVAAGGLVLSEFLPGTPPSRATFPQRNRVIAGLARATVVVEARERSGAGITARLALEAGREVLAVPGHPLAESAAGCLALLRDGARMAIAPADLLDAAGLETPEHPAEPADPLLRALAHPCTAEELATRCGLSPTAVIRRLARLELDGRIEHLSGDRFVQARR